MEEEINQRKNQKVEYTSAVSKFIFSFFTSIIKVSLAVALLILMIAIFVNAGDVIIESGKLNVSDNLYVDGTGKVGIGITSPAQKLDVTGQIHSTGDVCTDLAGGKCLSTAGSGGLPSGTSAQTLRHDGTNWAASSTLQNNGADLILVQNSNEAHIDIQNTEAGGRKYALVSSGTAGGLGGAGKFSIYDGSTGIDTSRLIIDADGDVGIGTISPGAKLDVNGDARTNGVLRFSDVGGTTQRGYIYGHANPNTIGFGTNTDRALLGNFGGVGFLVYDESTGSKYIGMGHDGTDALITSSAGDITLAPIGTTKPLVIKATSGNVGIGTTSPGAKLHLGGVPGTDGIMFPDGTLQTTAAAGGGGSNGWTKSGTSVYVTDTVNDNVGIGTSTPNEKLQVNGVIYTKGDSRGIIVDSGASKRVGLIKYAGREAGIWRLSSQDFEIGRVDNTVTSLPGAPVSYTTDLYVSGAGDVGVGTDTPQKKLHVLYNTAAGGPGATPGVVVENAGVQAEVLLNPGATGKNWILSADDGTQGFRLIEETSPGVYASRFQIKPAVTAGQTNAYLPSLEGSPSPTGQSLKYDSSSGLISYLTSSRRYKTNIRTMIDNFSLILKARPVVYNSKNSDASGYGYIAEELDELGLKNLVVYNKNSTPESVNYEMIGFYLVEVVKQQQKQIEQMNKTLLSQQKQIDEIAAEINKL